ncbi:MAG: helix-turn-helix domain-containing protein [Anaerolineales bacterium]|nr:helix-turn-helix domain-containing protein [Anaerolineales bacterium]
MDLKAFGQKLRQLRNASGLSQDELAKLIPVATTLVSNWERGYQHGNRFWRPDRVSLVILVKFFAGYLNANEAQRWLALADHTLTREELTQIFPDYIPPADPGRLRPTILALLPEQRLFGISQTHAQVRGALEQPEAPWLVALDGIGGIGKTSLAGALVRELAATGRFCEVAWVSAKQEEFSPGSGIGPTHRPAALDPSALTNSLLEQMGDLFMLTRPLAERQAGLAALLKKQPYLVVIDNLETLEDYQSVIPLLRQCANPTKFLLTTRHALHAYEDVYCLSLPELSRDDVLALLVYEAQVRGLTALAEASPAQLDSIYQVVGGNPLALKLVVGQIRALPLAQVLENLRLAQGKKVDDLYTYIYWQAWNALDEAGRQTLLAMPLAQNGTLAQLAALSELDQTALTQSLEHLATLSLLDVSANLEQPRYRIHRLTETFLLYEVIKWQQPIP